MWLKGKDRATVVIGVIAGFCITMWEFQKILPQGLLECLLENWGLNIAAFSLAAGVQITLGLASPFFWGLFSGWRDWVAALIGGLLFLVGILMSWGVWILVEDAVLGELGAQILTLVGLGFIGFSFSMFLGAVDKVEIEPPANKPLFEVSPAKIRLFALAAITALFSFTQFSLVLILLLGSQ